MDIFQCHFNLYVIVEAASSKDLVDEVLKKVRKPTLEDTVLSEGQIPVRCSFE